MFSHLPDHSRDQQVGKILAPNKPKTDTIHPKPKRVVHFRTRRSAPPSSHREEGLTTSGPTSGSSCAGRGAAAPPSSAAQHAEGINNKRSTLSYRGPPPAKRVTTAGPGLLLPSRKSTTSTTRFVLSRGNTARDQLQIKTTGGASSSGTTKNNNFLHTSSGGSCAGGTSNGGTVLRTSGTRRSCATGTRSSANYGAAVSRSSIIAGVRVGKNTTKGKTTSCTSRPSTYVVQREEDHYNCTGSSSSCASSSENYSNESIYNGSSSRSCSSDREQVLKAHNHYNPANNGNSGQNSSRLERTKAITASSAGGKSCYNTRASRRDKSNSRVLVSTKTKSTAGAAAAVPKPHKACQFLEDDCVVQRQRNHATNRRDHHRDIKQCDWSSTKSNPSSSSSWKKSSGTASSSYNRGNKNHYTYRSQRTSRRTRRRRRTSTSTSSSDGDATDRTVGTSELSSNTDIWPYYIDDKNHVRLIDPDEDESDSDPEYTQHEYNKEQRVLTFYAWLIHALYIGFVFVMFYDDPDPQTHIVLSIIAYIFVVAATYRKPVVYLPEPDYVKHQKEY
ncbi:unnamed protein product [Amoebophrya sp. A120]|nr:unnamed protein product [Amoebophrya sp. A120]|eukprot:GSA120T00004637001.1